MMEKIEKILRSRWFWIIFPVSCIFLPMIIFSGDFLGTIFSLPIMIFLAIEFGFSAILGDDLINNLTDRLSCTPTVLFILPLLLFLIFYIYFLIKIKKLSNKTLYITFISLLIFMMFCIRGYVYQSHYFFVS